MLPLPPFELRRSRKTAEQLQSRVIDHSTAFRNIKMVSIFATCIAFTAPWRVHMCLTGEKCCLLKCIHFHLASKRANIDYWNLLDISKMGHKPIDMYRIWQSQVSNISTYIIKEKKLRTHQGQTTTTYFRASIGRQTFF